MLTLLYPEVTHLNALDRNRMDYWNNMLCFVHITGAENHVAINLIVQHIRDILTKVCLGPCIELYTEILGYFIFTICVLNIYIERNVIGLLLHTINFFQRGVNLRSVTC